MPIDVQTSQDFGGARRILNLPAPASANEPVRLSDLNSAVEGIAWKDSVRVASAVNVTIASPGATINSITMAANDRVLLPVQTSGPENGIYIWNGAAVPMTRALDASTSDELEQAVVTVEEGTSAGSTFRQTLVNFVLGTGSPAFVSFGTSAPAATESTAGIAKVATQVKVDAGADDSDFLTALKLKNFSGLSKSFTATIGDGSSTSLPITHNLNSRNVLVEVYRNSGNYDTVLVETRRNTANQVTLIFDVAPAANAYAVVVRV